MGAELCQSLKEDTKSTQLDIAALRQIVDIAPVSMALAGIDGHLCYANDAFFKMFGMDNQSGVEGMHASDIVHPADAMIFRLNLARLRAGETEHLCSELRLQHAGTAFWVTLLARLVRNDTTQTPERIILQFADIGREKHAEGEMSTGESRLSFALDAARQGVWDLDFRSGTAYYSGMWREMRGIGPTDFIDSDVEAWLSRVHPEDRDRLRKLASQQNIGEVGYNVMEYREQHHDGHYIWIFSRGRPIEWMPDGTVARILGTDTDISALKVVEEKLAEEKERLRITLDSIGDGVISTDMDGNITFMNPVAERMTGWSWREAAGMDCGTIFVWHENHGKPSGDHAQVRRTAAPSERYADDGVLVSRSGERLEIHCTFSPVNAIGDEVVGQVLVFQDVTRNRELQRQLAYSATHDALTGLPNRRAFEQALEAAAAETDARHALLMIDLDKFKGVNDTGGHAAGDILLKTVGDSIRAMIGSQDLPSRIGGDEFAVILFNCDLAMAEHVGWKIVEAIQNIASVVNEKTLHIGASVGIVSLAHTEQGLKFSRERADRACYAAKSAGGSQVVVCF